MSVLFPYLYLCGFFFDVLFASRFVGWVKSADCWTLIKHLNLTGTFLINSPHLREIAVSPTAVCIVYSYSNSSACFDWALHWSNSKARCGNIVKYEFAICFLNVVSNLWNTYCKNTLCSWTWSWDMTNNIGSKDWIIKRCMIKCCLLTLSSCSAK